MKLLKAVSIIAMACSSSMVMAQELSGHVIPNTSAGNMVLP